MTKAIEDGYNHLVLNGTCGHLMITPVSGYLESFFPNYKPIYALTLEGGLEGVWDDSGIQASALFKGVYKKP